MEIRFLSWTHAHEVKKRRKSKKLLTAAACLDLYIYIYTCRAANRKKNGYWPAAYLSQKEWESLTWKNESKRVGEKRGLNSAIHLLYIAIWCCIERVR